MLDIRPTPMASAPRAQRASVDQQPRRLFLALVLLLAALVAVVIRDHEFWFGGSDVIVDSESRAPQAVRPTAVSAPARPAKAAAVPTTRKVAAKAAVETKSVSSNPTDSNAVTAVRTVLPPLDVEVVAGDNHRVVRPGSNATKVDINKGGSALEKSATMPPATSAAERERMSTSEGSYTASYPLLAQHMNVEGSVVLQALIGADGVIQNLHILSGPAILASAAQQAVREWKFKPVVQNGQAVETKATITVNFSIKIADGSSKEQLASAMPLRYSYTSGGASR